MEVEQQTTWWIEERELVDAFDVHLCMKELICKWLDRSWGERKGLGRAFEENSTDIHANETGS